MFKRGYENSEKSLNISSLYIIYTFHKSGEKSKMFEAKCKECDAVYTINRDSMPECFECLCGCEQFQIEENTLMVA